MTINRWRSIWWWNQTNEKSKKTEQTNNCGRRRTPFSFSFSCCLHFSNPPFLGSFSFFLFFYHTSNVWSTYQTFFCRSISLRYADYISSIIFFYTLAFFLSISLFSHSTCKDKQIEKISDRGQLVGCARIFVHILKNECFVDLHIRA